MAFMGLVKSKMPKGDTATIGLPVSRDVTIVAHIWPSDSSSTKDLRIHFHSKHPAGLESEVVLKILKVYGSGTEMNPVTGNIKCIVENPLIPLLTKKFADLGLNVKWVTVKT